MFNKAIKVSLLMALSVTLGYASFRYHNSYLSKSFYSAVALTIIYFVLKLIFEEVLATKEKPIPESPKPA